LASAEISIADLPNHYLGMEEPPGVLQAAPVVLISPDAAGEGWFIDPTLAGHSGFQATSFTTELRANPTGPADHGVDLLTVVEHELGHVLGLPDLDPQAWPGDLMDLTLAPGVRRLPSQADLGAIRDSSEPRAVVLPKALAPEVAGPALSPTPAASAGDWFSAGIGGPELARTTSSLASMSLDRAVALAPTQSTIEAFRPVNGTLAAAESVVLNLGPGFDSVNASLLFLATVTTAVADPSAAVPPSSVGPIDLSLPGQAAVWPRPAPLYGRFVKEDSASFLQRPRDPAGIASSQSPLPDEPEFPSAPVVRDSGRSSRTLVLQTSPTEDDRRASFFTALFHESFIGRLDQGPRFDHAIDEEFAQEVLSARNGGTGASTAAESYESGRSQQPDERSESASAIPRLWDYLKGLALVSTCLAWVLQPQSAAKKRRNERSAG
jgi:hypothetical protein